MESQATVLMAKQFVELRQLLRDAKNDVSEMVQQKLTTHGQELSHLSNNGALPLLSTDKYPLFLPLLSFYVLVDLAVSAAPNAELSVALLKDAQSRLSSLVISTELRAALDHWMRRLIGLMDAATSVKWGTSTCLTGMLLEIEVSNEPALLRSHLTRLQVQRNAILSLVESVDLVKKGQMQSSLQHFLESAVKTLTSEEHQTTDGNQEGGGTEEEVAFDFQVFFTFSFRFFTIFCIFFKCLFILFLFRNHPPALGAYLPSLNTSPRWRN